MKQYLITIETKEVADPMESVCTVNGIHFLSYEQEAILEYIKTLLEEDD